MERKANMKLVTLLLTALLAIPTHGQDAKTIHLPFKTVRSLMLVSVTIEGQEKTLIFDTGAERTLVNSLGGDREHTTSVAIAGTTLINFPIILSDLNDLQIRKLGKCDGVLGQDVLRRFKSFNIDFASSTIDLELK
jgi:hypothetical protein